jgi:hypothetical protein
MTMQEFNYLDGLDKTKILSHDGVLLAKRIEGCIWITLYQIDSFYVEIFYHKTRYFYVSSRTFEDAGGLEPYLSQIDISEIYSVLY